MRDPTGDTDSGVDDKRVLVLESEFANVLRVMERDGNILSRVVRDAWDRGDLATMTKNTPARATGAHISIVGHITADELRRYLTVTEKANGFANRFLFACVKRAQILPFGGALDLAESAALSADLARRIGVARDIERVTMDGGAQAAWRLVYEKLSDGKPGMLGAVTARAEAQAVRLGLLYALIEGSWTITAEHLTAALAVIDYVEASARYIFGDATGDPTADAIFEALRGAPTGLTRAQISEALGRNRPAAVIGNALTLLKDADRVVSNVIGTGGRSAEVWSVKP